MYIAGFRAIFLAIKFMSGASFELVDHLEGRHVASADAQKDSILLPK